MKSRAFFITGKPACGKDTQANLLAKRFGLIKIDSSGLIRNFFSRFKGKKILVGGLIVDLKREKEKYQKGELASHRFVGHLIANQIKSSFKLGQSIVIAGSPRSLIEAKVELKALIETYGQGDFFIFYLKVNNQVVQARSILRNRSDQLDRPAVFKKRLSVFKKEVWPGLVYLKSKKSLIEINGQGREREVFKRLIEKIN